MEKNRKLMWLTFIVCIIGVIGTGMGLFSFYILENMFKIIMSPFMVICLSICFSVLVILSIMLLFLSIYFREKSKEVGEKMEEGKEIASSKEIKIKLGSTVTLKDERHDLERKIGKITFIGTNNYFETNLGYQINFS